MSSKFNTAIFYDVENLIKGYSLNNYHANINVSLRDIFEAIRSEIKLEGIAVQKAYANWSNSKLYNMRFEINSLGIDPIQVFGFSKDSKKNAADIQLTIDAIDLAHTRPFIDTFIIISGDGGFSALAKKLHEYGKTVIGSAYKGTTNIVFESVCDHFIYLKDPMELNLEYEDDSSSQQNEIPHNQNYQQERKNFTSSSTLSNNKVNDPRNARLVRNIQPISEQSKDTIIEKTIEIINWYKADAISKEDIEKTGLFLPVIQEAVKFLIPGFQQGNIGFPKFIEYIQYLCTNTDLCVSRPPNSGVVLTFRKSTPNHWEILADIEERETHSLENYKTILAKATPSFLLPPKEIIERVIEWVINNNKQRKKFSEIVSEIQGINPETNKSFIKQAIWCLINSEILIKESDCSILDQELRIRPDINSMQMAKSALLTEINKALSKSISETNQDIINNILI